MRGARHGVSPGQRAVALILAALLATSVLLGGDLLEFLTIAVAPVFLAAIIVYLGAALERGPVAPPLAPRVSGRPWPTYTILVPLYREARVAGDLVACMAALDYPAERVEILFLLEVADYETIAALRRADLASNMRIILVPDGAPRTKPRALNHGLALARGEYVTIYDAEDIPEADQLRKAIIAFESGPDDVLCLQARLAIDNGDASWLSRMMQIEYAALFDILKRGLGAAALPIPLGGTSNHFRRRTLLALGGWDPWNVTEDADLGMRIARAGGHVADLDSTTFEEAPVTCSGWLHQRNRWLKGWCQTMIVHTRDPLKAMREMGPLSWVVAMTQLAGIVIAGLTFPFLSAHFFYTVASGAIFESGDWLRLVENALALTIAAIGGLTIVLPAVLGLRARGDTRLWPWLLTFPVYLLLISAAAWLAVIELFRDPYLWRKTEHGLSPRPRPAFRNTT
jgi:cellulose synthase/poly-beta-1,6-N-acetylglucosamine synthase-like glycosyltransferase